MSSVELCGGISANCDIKEKCEEILQLIRKSLAVVSVVGLLRYFCKLQTIITRVNLERPQSRQDSLNRLIQRFSYDLTLFLTIV